MSDTVLLEALFSNGWTVARENGRYRVEGCFPITDWMTDPRLALEKAIQLDRKYASSPLSLEENLHPHLFWNAETPFVD